MDRSHYKLFSPARLAGLDLPNRLVRSATWDPSILPGRLMTEEVLEIYRNLARGGVGLIITGGFPVARMANPGETPTKGAFLHYQDLRIDGIERVVAIVREARPECKIVAQVETGYLGAAPSTIPSPFGDPPRRPLAVEEIHDLIDCFVAGIVDMRAAGFDGVQLHAAHGGLLSTFLSPYTNRREDEYGGLACNRARIVREIVAKARERVGEFPILIKMNGTDYVPGGMDIRSFAEIAQEVERAGVDAIEISGGMWDCLVRPAAELGFRPVPTPEAHTRLQNPEQQSYFLPYAETMNLDIPVILVGGNRDVERLEGIVQGGKVDFIALSRPLIREPGLPERWRAGRGGRLPECVSCNACLYEMIVHPGREIPGIVRCVCKSDPVLHHQAQKWLANWVKENKSAGSP